MTPVQTYAGKRSPASDFSRLDRREHNLQPKKRPGLTEALEGQVSEEIEVF
jgi:hypothetical protein